VSKAALAWTLAAIAVSLHLVAHAFVLLGTGVGTPLDDEVNLGLAGNYVSFYAFPLVGAVVATRRPENAIAWLFVAIGICSGATFALGANADYALYADRATLPAGAWAAWAAAGFDVVFFIGINVTILLFPSGRLASRRWRLVLAALVAGGVLLGLVSLLEAGRVWDPLPVENPAGLAGVGTLLSVFEAVGALLLIPAALLTSLGALLRFRRAQGVERQQFKWFALAVVFLLVSLLLTNVPRLDAVAGALIGLGFAGIPIAVGIAILRYRLYDIDRVISKALAYGTLTVVLLATYAAVVLAGQTLFSSVAGGSNLVVAASTLVVAALFLPLRGRVQEFVDRRFYRRRYNVERTLQVFGAQLRDHVELDVLRTDLESVVHETMQPAHVSLWLREVRS
jgi:hypothetical protein